MIFAARDRRRLVLAAAWMPFLLVCPHLRDIVESRMALHMLLELPLLLAAGWAAAELAGDGFGPTRRYDGMDVQGLLGTTLVTSVALFWMLPAALDLSLLAYPMRLAKVASWWLAGFALRRTWPRLADESLAFFAGNMAWMLATAGLLYQADDARLCVNYLLDDQRVAGRALVVASLALGGLALSRLARRDHGASRPQAAEPRNGTGCTAPESDRAPDA